MNELDRIFAAAQPAVDAAASPVAGDCELAARLVDASLQQLAVGTVTVAATAAATTMKGGATASAATAASAGASWTLKVIIGVALLGAGVGVVALARPQPEPEPPTRAVVNTTARSPDPHELPAPGASPAQPPPNVEQAVQPREDVDAEVAPAKEDEGSDDSATAQLEAPASAEELLRRADALRSGRAFKAAVRGYRRVIREHPASREAAISRVNAAELLLDDLGQARAARKLYDKYLRKDPQGNLAEEALWGSAAASRKLGDASSEAERLRRLVLEHPSSVREGPAKKRLGQLESSE